MLTAENIAANRKLLGENLRASLNLPAALSDWSYAQRVEYNKQFAAYVLGHPASFGAQDSRTAQIVTAENPSALDDTSVSANLSAFGSALTDEVVSAGDAVGGIGRGVLNVASLAQWVIPAAGVVFVCILLYAEYKKRTKAA